MKAVKAIRTRVPESRARTLKHVRAHFEDTCTSVCMSLDRALQLASIQVGRHIQRLEQLNATEIRRLEQYITVEGYKHR